MLFRSILIAARNEETVIKNLINSLKKQNYPSNKYDVYVIVNNCTDNTLEVAKNAGAKIIECKQKVKSKGEVLKYTFNKLNSNDEIDAYVIFDADNVVHREFLNKMNDSINCGYEVVQGFRAVSYTHLDVYKRQDVLSTIKLRMLGSTNQESLYG